MPNQLGQSYDQQNNFAYNDMMSDDRSNNGMFAGGLKPPSYNDF